MSDKPQLLYFDIRGRAEPIRLLLKDLGVPFTDRQITLEEWPALRSSTPFRRMPVYSESDLEIPETFAILNHLGRKYGMLGDTEVARVRCDVTIEIWRDYGNRIAHTFGALSKSEADRKRFVGEELPELLNPIEIYYGARGTETPYWAGEVITIADFVAFDMIDGAASQFPDALARFPALKTFRAHFANRPNIERYLVSSRRPDALFYGSNGKIYPAA